MKKLLSVLLALALLAAMIPAAMAEEEIAIESDDPAEEFAEEFAEEMVDEVEPELGPIDIDLEAEDEPVPGDGDETAVAEEQATFASANAAGSVALTAENFPDPEFLSYIKTVLRADANGDGVLSEAELAAPTYISIGSNDALKSLEGIQHFPNLSWVRCDECPNLTDLDISKNGKVTYLDANNSALKTLALPAGSALVDLYLEGNSLTALDISGCAGLESLQAADNKLTALNVSRNTKLKTLDLRGNALTGLDLTQNAQLTNAYVDDNQLTTLALPSSNALTAIFCGNNKLTSLDLTNKSKLKYLWCNKNSITHLGLSDCPILSTAVKKHYITRGESGIAFYKESTDIDDSDPLLLMDEATLAFEGGKTIYDPDKLLLSAADSVVIGVGEKYDLLSSESLISASECTFKSLAPKTAKVSSKGVVTGVKKNTTTVTASFGDLSVTTTVQVKKAPSRVSLSKSSLKLVAGKTKAITVKLPSGTASHKLTWSTSNKKVAYYDTAKGKIVAVGPGTATVSVKTFNKKRASCKVKVTAPAPTFLDLGVDTLNLHLKETFKLVPVIDEGAETTFKYSSSKRKFATVSAKGVITGVKAGTAVITVKTKNGLKRTVTVKVSGKMKSVSTYVAGTSGISVYTTLGAKYLHYDSDCTELDTLGTEISEVTLEEGLNYDKKPCPTCAASLNRKVYALAGGTYYHSGKSHAGSKAKKYTLAVALASGMTPCPVCYPWE